MLLFEGLNLHLVVLVLYVFLSCLGNLNFLNSWMVKIMTFPLHHLSLYWFIQLKADERESHMYIYKGNSKTLIHQILLEGRSRKPTDRRNTHIWHRDILKPTMDSNQGRYHDEVSTLTTVQPLRSLSNTYYPLCQCLSGSSCSPEPKIRSDSLNAPL